MAYFPPRLQKKCPDALKSHRLRREIIATVLSNGIVNRMGMAFCQRLADELGLARDAVVRAYTVTTEVFGADALWRDIEALDCRVAAAVQYRAHARVIGLVKHAVQWLLSPDAVSLSPLAGVIDRYQPGARKLEAMLPDVLPRSYREEWDQAVRGGCDDGLPEPLAVRLANARVLGSAPDIIELSRGAELALAQAANAYFEVGERFSVPWLLGAIIALQAEGRWQALARATLREDVYRVHRKLAAQILSQGQGSIGSRMESWLQANDRAVRFVLQRIGEIQATGTRDFQALSVILREFRKLARLG
jgi:glutamate dehydrogenase